MTSSEKLLLEAHAWTTEKVQTDEELFQRLLIKHNPKMLWIGTVDSLVPVREVTNTDPGEILIYQNIANQVEETDSSLLAVLEEAITSEQLELIIVCGYSHCGGIRDVVEGCEGRHYVSQWLSGLSNLYETNRIELDALPYEEKIQRLAELNIREQIVNLSQMEMIKAIWEKKRAPMLIGWYFDLSTGCFSEVFRMDPALA